MCEFIDIADRRIGPGQPCFIIAEAGVNHNGDPDAAMRLVDAAKEAGADAVKFQTFITSKLVAPSAPMANYQRENVGREQSQYEMLRQLELPFSDFERLQRHAASQRLMFLSTADDAESADFLDSIGVPAFKIASGEIDNFPLLIHIATKGKPIILSTGMTTLGEVESAVKTIVHAGNDQLILLHCVSSYPAPAADCNLRAMETLARSFGYPVGFSDHTEGIDVALAAIARGACILEKHFTISKSLQGPDHRVSLEPAELAELTAAARNIEVSLGSGIKQPSRDELQTRKVVRRSIVATRFIQEGELICESDLSLMRTVGGLAPAFLPYVIGRKARSGINAMETVTFESLA
jgi:N,N'-diacetyllegionaminate synthase